MRVCKYAATCVSLHTQIYDVYGHAKGCSPLCSAAAGSSSFCRWGRGPGATRRDAGASLRRLHPVTGKPCASRTALALGAEPPRAPPGSSFVPLGVCLCALGRPQRGGSTLFPWQGMLRLGWRLRAPTPGAAGCSAEPRAVTAASRESPAPAQLPRFVPAARCFPATCSPKGLWGSGSGLPCAPGGSGAARRCGGCALLRAGAPRGFPFCSAGAALRSANSSLRPSPLEKRGRKPAGAQRARKQRSQREHDGREEAGSCPTERR